MAHPKLSRPTVTAGLTAALLTVPFASVSFATTGLQVDVEPATEELEELGDETAREPHADVQPVIGAVEEVLEDLVGVDAEPPPATAEPLPAPASSDGSGDDGGAEAAGDFQPVEQPRQQPAGGDAPPARTSPPAVNDNGQAAREAEQAAAASGSSGNPALGALRSGLRSRSSLTLQPLEPVVSAPFAFATTPAPKTAASYTSTTMPSLSALEASMTTAGTALPAGVPGSLVASTAGLLLLLGGAHVLHRRGLLEVRES